MTPEEVAKLDQSLAVLADRLPAYLRRTYEGLLEEGFDKDQAAKLLCAWLHGFANGRLQ